jgi:ribonuclease E
MANKMLIDATHPEETRVVVLRGNRVEEFDFESANRKQLRGNIYLAKVTRVEPSLQAAFVDYGGNRHGFLAFSEIHPDYYQIPVADRQALLEEESRAHRDEDEEQEHRGGGRRRGRSRHRGADRNRDRVRSAPVEGNGEPMAEGEQPADARNEGEAAFADAPSPVSGEPFAESHVDQPLTGEGPQEAVAPETTATPASEQIPDIMQTAPVDAPAPVSEAPPQAIATSEADGDQPHYADGDHHHEHHAEREQPVEAASEGEARAPIEPNGEDDDKDENGAEEEEIVESLGGDALEEMPERSYRTRRQYKIQEVIKRRQIMLVQVVKEERGTKGAALTTYLSLAGRYSVLMPNTARGGGISRKITSAEDRRRLKEVAEELEVPEGMGVILRTAGANRTKLEVKRDFEYLLRLWETIRDLTLRSTAPTLTYEEGSLVKRSIRDLYSKEIDEIIVAGDEAYKEAKDFMRMLMPSHAKAVKSYRDPQPLFTRYGIESQLDAMFQPTVQLKSGGYIVINQAEALVAIDVNSGRATREHNIEDTALKTNSEAAVEVARQLRLRDLAGLIVIDFIDMEEGRNNRAVERRLKEALKSDRARIQVGRISHFGLMEMSRQRIRTSVLESSTEVCPHCGGTGHVRSVSSVALQLLRGVEEMLQKGATHNLIVRTRSECALYVLNHKRGHLSALENRFKIAIAISADATMTGQPPFTIDRGEQVMTLEQARALIAQSEVAAPIVEEDEDDVIDAELAAEEEAEEETGETYEHGDDAVERIETIEPVEAAEPGESSDRGERDGRGRKRRRGRGRGRGRDRDGEAPRDFTPREPVAARAEGEQTGAEPGEEADDGAPMSGEPSEQPGGDHQQNGEGRRRRRGRRGGRRNRRGRDGEPQFGGPNGEGPHNGEGQPHAEEQPREYHSERPAEQPYQPPPRLEEAPPREARAFDPPAPQPFVRPEPVSPPVEMPQSEPKRRSTIREPAPIFGAGAPSPTAPVSPPPAPVVTEAPAADEAGKPVKRGWWRRG